MMPGCLARWLSTAALADGKVGAAARTWVCQPRSTIGQSASYRSIVICMRPPPETIRASMPGPLDLRFGEIPLDAVDIFQGAGRGHVSAIEQHVEVQLPAPRRRRRGQQGLEMGDVRVDVAVG